MAKGETEKAETTRFGDYFQGGAETAPGVAGFCPVRSGPHCFGPLSLWLLRVYKGWLVAAVLLHHRPPKAVRRILRFG